MAGYFRSTISVSQVPWLRYSLVMGSSASILAKPTAPPNVTPYEADRMYPIAALFRRTTSPWNIIGSGSVMST